MIKANIMPQTEITAILTLFDLLSSFGRFSDKQILFAYFDFVTLKEPNLFLVYVRYVYTFSNFVHSENAFSEIDGSFMPH